MKARYYAELDLEHPDGYDKHDVATWFSCLDGVEDITVWDSFEDLRLDKEEEPQAGAVPLAQRELRTILRTTDDQEVQWRTSLVDGQPKDVAICSPPRLQPTEWFTIRGGSFHLEGDGDTWRAMEEADVPRITCRGILLDPQFWQKEEEPT